MKSIYHILDKPPAIEKDEVPLEYEELAIRLVKSGRFRIDTDYYCNFVKYYDPTNEINIILSLEELNNPDLEQLTKDSIKELYVLRRKTITDKKISSIISSLKNKSKKLLAPTNQVKMRLARMFVQSAHPIVIRWLLYDRVQVFITYSHSIGDVMSIVDWKRSGKNSGMQSTDGVNACVYVSCGGDPFGENYEENPTIGGGWAAAARLQIIAGQEIGHFADIKRDHKGNQITRHSADFACTKATPHVKQARREDISRCDRLISRLGKAGIINLMAHERDLRFYDRQKIGGLRVMFIRVKIAYYRRRLLKFATQKKMHFIKRFTRDRYMGTMIMAMIEDMKSHLSPVADVYKRNNPEAEEAIACVEALARVPQQVMKWGYLTTRATMHDLYHVYYREVIPSLIESYEAVSGKKYKRTLTMPKPSLLKQILQPIPFLGPRILKLLGKKKFQFNEVRLV